MSASIAARAAVAFPRVPGYLNTATLGLPPHASVDVFRGLLDEWEEGRCDPRSFDTDVARCREAYASIAGTVPSTVGIVSQVSVVSGLVAASLPEGATVLVAEEEFTSVIFPFLADRRLSVRTVPLRHLLEEVGEEVDLVAVSAVQSSDGAMLDLDHLHHVAQRTETRTYVDVTQAAGWLPLAASRFDVTACHAYKWLCAPRGAGFMTVGPGAGDWLRPVAAGWYGGEDPWDSIYGPPLRLARDARRFDLSPPWFSFAAAVPALEILADIGPEAIGAYDLALADRFRSAVGLGPGGGAIVAIERDAGPALREAGISAAMRAGGVRLSFHLYNTEADVDRAAETVLANGGVRTD